MTTRHNSTQTLHDLVQVCKAAQAPTWCNSWTKKHTHYTVIHLAKKDGKYPRHVAVVLGRICQVALIVLQSHPEEPQITGMAEWDI